MKSAYINVILLLLLAATVSCRRQPEGTSVGAAVEVVHQARGVIREFPVGSPSVVIRHEAIPGFMPKMTMTLNVRDTHELLGFREGDEITFRLHATADEHWIDQLKRVGHSGDPALEPALVGPSDPELRPGQELPDFEFLSEAGRPVHLAEFRGKAMALTFIFTQCPLPEFCPRMSRHFSKARNLLITDTHSSTNWLLLSLSFDPENDSPAVLRTYARGHRGSNGDRWLFGVLSSAVLSRLSAQIDLKFTREGGSISHNLRTLVLDTRGRIHRQFDGNDWTPEQLVASIHEAAEIKVP